MKRITGKDVETLHYDKLPGSPMTGIRWPPPGADQDSNWQNSEQNQRVQSVIQKFSKLDAVRCLVLCQKRFRKRSAAAELKRAKILIPIGLWNFRCRSDPDPKVVQIR